MSEQADKIAAMASTSGEVQGTARLLRVPEVAEKLRLSVWSVYRKVENGEIPAVRLGTGPMAPIRIDERELREWLLREGA